MSEGESGASLESKWLTRKPLRVDYEDTMAREDVAKVWEAVYEQAKARNEEQKAATRLAVYVYGAKNGTVRVGNYGGTIQVSYGQKFSAKVISTACKGTIRQFYRGNMDESYEALSESRALNDDERLVARALSQNVPLAAIISLCDWFKDCSKMSQQEQQHHDRLFTIKNAAAYANRGGTSDAVQNRLVAETEMGGMEVRSPAGQPVM